MFELNLRNYDEIFSFRIGLSGSHCKWHKKGAWLQRRLEKIGVVDLHPVGANKMMFVEKAPNLKKPPLPERFSK